MKNKLFYGDNLEILRQYVNDESIDLCYIDPPFNSKRNYNQIYNNIGHEDKAQAHAFSDTWTWNIIADEGLRDIKGNHNKRFTKQSILLITGLEKVLGHGSLLAYLVSMTLRIAEVYRVLKPTGTFYFHCDPTASHYLKLVLDAVFCARKGEYQNEIIWCYKSGGASKSHFAKKHDIIFRYTKSDKFTFNYEKEKSYGQTGGGQGGKVQYYKDEIGTYSWAGIKDWWIISMLSTTHSERLGYPTQKPEALLERIIKASSNKGDVILDAYCGCGTSVAVAQKLKRKWIGIDITYQSISLILKRMEDSFTQADNVLDDIDLNGVPQDFDSAIQLAHKKDDRTRKEFEKWAVLTYSKNRAMINEKKGGDGGIDGTAYVIDREDNKEVYKEALFSVKSNQVLTPSVIRDLNGTIERENAACGFLITLYPMPNLVKESKKYGTYKNELTGQVYPKIQVINVTDVLDGKHMELPHHKAVLKSVKEKTTTQDLQPDLF